MLHLQKTDIDWAYYAEKSDKASLGLPKGSYWPRGKVLGGSSAINAMLYLRGNRRDYNSWKDLGNPGWGWTDVLPYFKKSEDNKLDHLFEMHGNKFHGKGGPLKINKYWSMDEDIKYVIIDALQERGHQEIWDFNGEDHIGWATVAGTLDNGQRASSATAFLTPIKDRPNLQVIKNAHVTRVLFEAGTKDVTGVEFMLNDVVLKAKARKETVLSAGSLNTPQILMLSGIGPSAHLKSMNIPVVSDLKVGHNLQDHVIVPYFVSVYRNNKKPVRPEDAVNALYSYYMHRLGPIAGLGSSDYIGFINTQNKSDPFPDLQFHNFYFKQGGDHFSYFLKGAGFNEEIEGSLKESYSNGNILVYYVTLLKQEVPGKVELYNIDPKHQPKIITNYLEADEEVERAVRGIRMLQTLKGTPTYTSAEAEEIHVKIAECDELDYDSDDYWRCYTRYMSTTLYHPVGTAKMGPDSDDDAVLTPELKVRGVTNLRVIDASVMPIIPSANTNAASIMVGEKGSDLIKSSWSDAIVQESIPLSKDEL